MKLVFVSYDSFVVFYFLFLFVQWYLWSIGSNGGGSGIGEMEATMMKVIAIIVNDGRDDGCIYNFNNNHNDSDNHGEIVVDQ